MPLRRILLVRHGETDGQSSVRYHGSSDVDLSARGQAQMRATARRLGVQRIDLVVASPLKRSWRSAALLARGAPVRLEAGLREIHFGRWEGLSREEIRATDPTLFEDWQSGREGFEFPEGERRAAFRERVGRALDSLLASDANSALLVLHKGVIREIVRRLAGEELGSEEPALGEPLVLTRRPDGSWFRGQHSSNPPGLDPPEPERVPDVAGQEAPEGHG